MRRFAYYVILAPLVATLAAPALAQAIPPGQSCGGLLCDMGVFGHKVALGPNGEPPSQEQMAAAEVADPHRLPCHDFLCRAFGGKEDVAAPPPPAPVAAVVPDQPAKPARKSKRKHVARAETAPPEGAAAK